MTKARQQAGQRVPKHSSKHALPTALPAVPKHVVWGSGRVCSTLLSHPQQSASVRNRPTVRNCPRTFTMILLIMAVPMGSAAKVVTFGGFKRRVTSFRVAGVALCDIPTCFTTCQKSFCVTGAKLLHRFQEMISISRGRRSTLDVSIFVAGTAL